MREAEDDPSTLAQDLGAGQQDVRDCGEGQVHQGVDREQRIAALESKLAAEDNRRVSAIDTIDQILVRVDELESDVTSIGTSNGSEER